MIITLHVRHSLLQQRFFECKFESEAPLSAAKESIYRMTGTMPQHQALKLILSGSNEVQLGSDSSCLSDYGAQSGMELFVEDLNPLSVAKDVGLNDLSTIEKYVMSDDVYDKLEGTVRHFLREKFKNDPEYRRQVLQARRQRQQEILHELDLSTQISIGSRCRLLLPGNRRGTILFNGSVPSLGPGPILGIQLDEPTGDTDGSHGGIRYFTAEKNYGLFLRPSKVEVGDFPEQALSDLDDDDSVSDL
ncbi:Tubulin specific chaperone B [Giardia muris]|uniref:Tubulin specific chaperone B n=1 Tax=Giardia muris TaxID=5742 RepID=A0A4Z1SWP1_GIAMU|nr:Tubulin specific chaperone B [Giardia muris]|eukprot:TNJ30174.1 Tubulin specific chaperone B [Giardia muris]